MTTISAICNILFSKAVSLVDDRSIRSTLLNFGSCLCLHSQSSLHIPSNMAEMYEKFCDSQKSRLMFVQQGDRVSYSSHCQQCVVVLLC
jgi:hypothetical protein